MSVCHPEDHDNNGKCSRIGLKILPWGIPFAGYLTMDVSGAKANLKTAICEKSPY